MVVSRKKESGFMIHDHVRVSAKFQSQSIASRAVSILQHSLGAGYLLYKVSHKSLQSVSSSTHLYMLLL